MQIMATKQQALQLQLQQQQMQNKIQEQNLDAMKTVVDPVSCLILINQFLTH